MPIASRSGGERQAIAIARAMCYEADLIVMDVPTNNLGAEEADGLMRFIRVAKEAGHSSVLSATTYSTGSWSWTASSCCDTA
jgi:simple sugar transport system ATP-binding protein